MKQLPKIAKIFDYKMWFHDFVKITGCLPVLFYHRLKTLYIAGKRPKGLTKGKIVIFANHRSWKDPVVILNGFGRRRVCFLATQTIFKSKFVGLLLKGMRTIPVDRENPGVKSFQKAKEILDRGHLVGVFPEAHVTKQDEIQHFSPGAVLMAILSDAALLPVYIANKKKWFNRQVIVIGNKIDYKQYINNQIPTIDEIDKITQILQSEEQKLKEYYDSWKIKKVKHE